MNGGVHSPPPLVVIVGPTAAGKSSLAVAVAQEHGGEIVSCDSLQVFRGLDIGSAKAGAAERSAVPHHMLDVAAADSAYSAADYARAARAALANISERARLPVVVGGTGLYLRALLDGLFDGPSRDEQLRARLDRIAARFGNVRLHRLLAGVDPKAAARIEPNDRVRIVRACEVFLTTGRPLSAEQGRGAAPLTGFRVGIFGLDPGREALAPAITARTRAMLAAGLVEEARTLRASGYSRELRPLRAIGYAEAFAMLDGTLAEADAERVIVTRTLRYAKRQRTWFRHQVAASWSSNRESALAAIREWLLEERKT